MPHIVFFSYVRKDLDPVLEIFFRDLCHEIALHTTDWAAEDEEISFRDTNNLRLMENWKPHIVKALQSSSVLVCITTPKYFTHPFCGKEYWFFDRRRRQGLPPGSEPPPVILPVIWVPTKGEPPAGIKDMQQTPHGIPELYRQKGLRQLKFENEPLYHQCVAAFATTIREAWGKHKIAPLPDIQDFLDVPNAFADGEWLEAADKQQGWWLRGPEVANFLFVAGKSGEIPAPEGRYGAKPSAWRPYLPATDTSIADHAKNAAEKQSFKFREIAVDASTPDELKAAKDRKNLCIVIGDPKSLALDKFKPVQAIDDLLWTGTSMILPCDDIVVKWNDELEKELLSKFPVIMQTRSPKPLRTDGELIQKLETTLTELHTAVRDAETAGKQSKFPPPPVVSVIAGSRS